MHLMHDFLIRGWLHWRTLGEQGAGGWYQQDNPPWADGLYAVAERYPEPREANPAFTVSLLGHEAQHVADHHAFPGLGSADLEYRAKLVELIGFTSAEERLAFFLADAADDPLLPHPWAAHRIHADLAARLPTAPADRNAWLAVPYEEIRRLALELLDADTARRLPAVLDWSLPRAAVRVTHAVLRRAVQRVPRRRVRDSPVHASGLGLTEYDDQLDDLSGPPSRRR